MRDRGSRRAAPAGRRTAAPQAEQASALSPPPVSGAPEAPPASQGPAPAHPAANGSPAAVWQGVLDQLPAGLLIRPYLALAVPQGPTPAGEWAVAFSRAAAAHREYVDTVKYRRLIGGVLAGLTGREWKICFTLLDDAEPAGGGVADPTAGEPRNGLAGLAEAVASDAGSLPSPVVAPTACPTPGADAAGTPPEAGGGRPATGRKIIRNGLQKYEQDPRVHRAMSLFAARLVEIRE